MGNWIDSPIFIGGKELWITLKDIHDWNGDAQPGLNNTDDINNQDKYASSYTDEEFSDIMKKKINF